MGFVPDEEESWIAELECGHRRQVRQDPGHRARGCPIQPAAFGSWHASGSPQELMAAPVRSFRRGPSRARAG
ncbi:MAG: DUF3565 domain-containing protein [Rhizobacter sp.]|nr:DUF3565 domain-containing protein [Rhizobacter sp.]